MAVNTSLGQRVDPLLGYNFAVGLVDSTSTLEVSSAAIASVTAGGFSECTGLEMALDTEKFEQGGENGTIRQFPVRVRWTNLTLRRGITTNTALWDWHYAFIEGRGKRKDGFVALLDDRGRPSAVWAFRRGLPVKYTGPSLNASQGQVALEGLEIAHEGLVQIPTFASAGAPQRSDTPATRG